MRQIAVGSFAGACLVAAAALAPAPAAAREMVAFRDSYSAGTIVVKTTERRLYLVLGNGQALRYPVGVGKSGKQWSGTARIDGKYLKPDWSPPAEVKRDRPRIPNLIPGGSPANPMGAAALTLSGGEYAIHGTNYAELGRRLRLVWLHPHVQPGRGRPVRARQRRHHRGGHALKSEIDRQALLLPVAVAHRLGAVAPVPLLRHLGGLAVDLGAAGCRLGERALGRGRQGPG